MSDRRNKPQDDGEELKKLPDSAEYEDDYDNGYDDRADDYEPDNEEYDSAAARRRHARDAGRQFRQRISEADEEEDKGPLLSPTVKGLIGILIALVFVALVIMLFAKILFLHEKTGNAKTGTITVTSPTGTTAMTTTGLNQRQSRTTKETIKYNDNAKSTDSSSSESTKAVQIKCISAVLVHPQPNSSSANLTTVPYGATVEFIRNENGWYYIKYNGTTGYAWGQFFETPKEANDQ